jgi:metallo-beta-lactamase family protein
MKNKTFIKFFGGVGSVTGANFLLETTDDSGVVRKIMIDCGMTQGTDFADSKNREPFPFDPKTIDILFITHAHMDHIGRVPKLVKDGFAGKIISTPQTMEMVPYMLEDAQKIMEEDSRAGGVLPIYDKVDVDNAVRLWSGISYGEKMEVFPGISVHLKDAGHILGSAIFVFKIGENNVVFTGDLGNSPSPILKDTEKIIDANYIVMESVYGDRNHENREERTNILKETILKTVKNGGVLLIPIFSIEKTQVILYEINNLVEQGDVPSVPVFLDSPLAIKITSIYKKYKNLFNDRVKNEIEGGDDIFNFPKLKFTMTSRESESIFNTKGPKIIIAGSGMSTGGRINKHEKIYLGDSKNAILFVGYQSAGSLGRKIQEGMKEVYIHGEKVNVKAHIESISGYSSHKDMDGLVDFVSGSQNSLKKVFVVMGEPKSAFFLANRLRDYLDVDAIHPEEGEVIELV